MNAETAQRSIGIGPAGIGERSAPMSESPGKVLDLSAVFGLKAIVTTPAEATGGAYVEMDVTAEPAAGP